MRIALSLFVLGATLGLCGCTPKMDHDEIVAIVTPAEGLIGGYKPGDRWEDIKAKHNPKLRVREDMSGQFPIRQLRMDLGRPGENCVYISFNVDGAGVVTSLDLAVHGERDNAVLVRRLDDELLEYYDKKLGKPTTCGKGYCSYDTPDGKHVNVGYQKFEGSPISGMVSVRLGS